MAMITGCPSCATRGNLTARHAGGDTWLRGCPACGHDWLEAKAVELPDGRATVTDTGTAMVRLDDGQDIVIEARRLAEAARLTAERHRAQRRARRATRRGWAMLGAAVLVPLAGAAAFPDSVTRAAPAAASLYRLAGIEVNVFGFQIRDAASELQSASGAALLAVRGEVVNVTDTAREVPALSFVLRDERGVQTFAWTLNGVGSRRLEPGEATSFLTRVAAPPVDVEAVEIRFARDD